MRSWTNALTALAMAALLTGCSAADGTGSDPGASGAAPEAGGSDPDGAGPGAGGDGGAGSGGGGTVSTGGAATSTGGAGGAGASTGAVTAGGSVPATGEVDCRTDGDRTTTLVFVNRCPSAVTYAGSDLEGGTLESGAFECVDIGSDVEELSSKRYWGWVGEDPGPERHTLAEFTFNTDFYDFDWYNISHVDAHNLPMSIVPVARPDCHTLSCPQDFLASCPETGQVRSAGGAVVSCVSPDRDDPSGPVVLLFEQCDDAYVWSGDDANGEDTSPMRACAGEDWDIVFCPGEGA